MNTAVPFRCKINCIQYARGWKICWPNANSRQNRTCYHGWRVHKWFPSEQILLYVCVSSHRPHAFLRLIITHPILFHNHTVLVTKLLIILVCFTTQIHSDLHKTDQFFIITSYCFQSQTENVLKLPWSHSLVLHSSATVAAAANPLLLYGLV